MKLNVFLLGCWSGLVGLFIDISVFEGYCLMMRVFRCLWVRSGRVVVSLVVLCVVNVWKVLMFCRSWWKIRNVLLVSIFFGLLVGR